MTNQIKFSHNYPKLWNQTSAKLLNVFEIDYINDSLKKYDTKWHEDGEFGYYPLPEGKKIQLVFIGNFNIPFCTIRRYTLEKFRYYFSKIGEDFIIEMEKKTK